MYLAPMPTKVPGHLDYLFILESRLQGAQLHIPGVSLTLILYLQRRSLHKHLQLLPLCWMATMFAFLPMDKLELERPLPWKGHQRIEGLITELWRSYLELLIREVVP